MRITEVITSSKNERIKNVCSLQKSKKARTEQSLFVVEGVRIAVDTVKSAKELIDSVYVSESFIAGDNMSKHPELADAVSRATVVKDSVFASMCETVTPQGIICVVRQPEYTYEDIVKVQAAEAQTVEAQTTEAQATEAQAVEAQKIDEVNGSVPERVKILVLEDIQDPGNLGTMIRTAEAAGVNGIIMSRGTTDIFSPKVTRSTMGGIFRVPFIYVDSLTDTLDRLKDDGIRVYAAYLRSGRPFGEVSYAARAAVMIGNEGNGLSDEAVAHASENVFIPMAGEVESLNASVAAALLMYRL